MQTITVLTVTITGETIIILITGIMAITVRTIRTGVEMAISLTKTVTITEVAHNSTSLKICRKEMPVATEATTDQPGSNF